MSEGTNPAQFVSNALACIKAAKERRALAVAEAERVFQAESGHHERALYALARRYRDKAFALACEDGDAPFTPSGGHWNPTEAEATEDGVELRWYNNDGPDWYYTASWAALLGEEPAG